MALLRIASLGLLAGWLMAAAALPVAAQAPSGATEAQVQALRRASDAVVGVQAIAVDDAQSNATLGRARRGSGVVIGPDGLVLTIGYLILEADQVMLTLDDGRQLPARVAGYDVATGFGLLQPLAPLGVAPAPLAAQRAPGKGEPVLVVSGGQQGGVSVARLVSQRPFAGYWEYMIDGALFTVPPRPDHSGAALFNSEGELLGIGSLLVADALGADAPRAAGNMFVPVELLRPILQELRTQGTTALSRRAWMGVNCVEQAGEVRVIRVSSDSPAAAAGLQPGDRIVRIDGVEVDALQTLWTALWRGGRPEREVTLDIRRGGEARQVKMTTVDRQQTLRQARGI